MRYVIASALVIATVLAGVVGGAFADPGEFDAPAQDRQIITGTAAGTTVAASGREVLAERLVGSDAENKHNLER